MNKVWKAGRAGQTPARATVEAKLAARYRVEIQIIAATPIRS